MTTMTRVHVLVSGDVQGVFYRATAQDTATRLGLRGWVRNLVDGRVEAQAEGPEDLVQEFVAWCREGPRAARVEAVEVEVQPHQGDLPAFTVLR
jgi:acylphosphatase